MMIRRAGRPSVVNEDLVRAVEEKIQENRRFTISSLTLYLSQIPWRQRGQRRNVVCIAGGIILRCRVQKLMPRYEQCIDSGRYAHQMAI
jgi:hypothetical protein